MRSNFARPDNVTEFQQNKKIPDKIDGKIPWNKIYVDLIRPCKILRK